MHLTASTAELASAAGDAVRLLPGRTLDPVLSGLLLVAEPDGLLLAGNDRERGIRLRCPAVVHEEGRVLVPARPLAETLRALGAPQVSLRVEGSRLAVRTDTSRFALPLLDVDSHPGVPEPPAPAGRVHGEVLAGAVAPVAAAASRDDALPVFTGVRLHTRGEQLVLVATDRYRMAVAALPWRPERGGLDVLVPATLLAEAARQIPAGTEAVLHADEDRAGLSWPGVTVTTAVLASPFPDETRYLEADAACTIEIDADTLAAAVRRVAPYAGARGVVQLETGEGELRVCGADPQSGEAVETIKATVGGDLLAPAYQARFLSDALRAFPGSRVRIAVQQGRRSTLLCRAEPDPSGVDLRYVVVPILTQR